MKKREIEELNVSTMSHKTIKKTITDWNGHF